MSTHFGIGPAKKSGKNTLINLVRVHELQKNSIRRRESLKGLGQSLPQGFKNMFILNIVDDPLIIAFQSVLETNCERAIHFLTTHKIIVSVSGDGPHPCGHRTAPLELTYQRRAFESPDQTIAENLRRQGFSLARRGSQSLKLALQGRQKLGENPGELLKIAFLAEAQALSCFLFFEDHKVFS